MKRYCIIGWPLTHTDSPKLHNAAFAHAGIDAVYEAQSVESEKLAEFMQNFRANFAGANVTIPHKVEVMRFLDEIDATAQAIGAVNTIVNENGKLIGYNTDAFGARACLPGGMAALQTVGANVTDAHVLVLGAGGAARAIVYALREAVAHVSIFNRTFDKAQLLAEEFSVSAVRTPHAYRSSILRTSKVSSVEPSLRLVEQEGVSEMSAVAPIETSAPPYDIIINATACGMTPNQDETPLPNYDFSPRTIVMDIVYKPLMTKLLSDARDAGCTIVTGDIMLKLQAQESFRLFTGRDMDFLELFPQTLGDYISDDETPESKKEHQEFIATLRLKLNNFSQKDQQIIRMRFGLDDGIGHSLEEVGNKHNVSREYLRNIENTIIISLSI